MHAVAGVTALFALYVALVHFGVLRSPFDPVLRGDVALARSDAPGLRVLFVGNSFTFSNSLPELVHELAAADDGAPPIYAVGYTAGGWSLRRASRNARLRELLHDVEWDVVVLQERSMLLSFSAGERAQETDPFARALDARIDASGARTMLFMTWGYKSGDSWNVRGDTYEAMQERLETGYIELGRKLDAQVVPVGLAWAQALVRRPGLDLWADDGRHPSRLGSYLAACVFYAVLSARDPTMSRFDGGLSRSDARLLRDVAREAVAEFERPRH